MGDVESRRHRRRLPSGFATLRDLLSFVAGLILIGHQAFARDVADPTAMLVGVSLMGLPLVFGERGGVR